MDNEESPLQHTIQRIKQDACDQLLNPVVGDINYRENVAVIKRDERGRLLPGQSLNPLGRPPLESTLPSCIRAELEKIDEKTGKTNAQLIAEQVISKAKHGDPKLMEIALDYVTGKPTQQILTAGVTKLVVEYAPETAQNAQGDTQS